MLDKLWIFFVGYNGGDMEENASLFKTMVLIRKFEEKLLSEFASGKVNGTTHTYIGQEADAAGIFSVTDPEDVIFSNHRCHGHFLAYGGDPYLLAAELLGKTTGLVGGRGGSQHIHWKNFHSNGIQGGIVPIATGCAMAEKIKGSSMVTLVFLGDGTLGEGVVYESLNIASLWKLPILFILEDNGIAQTTPASLAVAGSIKGRFTAFGIPVQEITSSDVLVIREASGESLEAVRKGDGPACLILHTRRFMAHSKGDDTRSAQELEEIRSQDPLEIHGSRLTKETLAKLVQTAGAIVDDAFIRAGQDLPASLTQ